MSYPTNSIYSEHHRRTAKWIIDDDTRLVHMELWLTPQEMVGLKLNETVWIDGRAYIINKIKDWDPKSDRLTKVELITANDTEIAAFAFGILGGIVVEEGGYRYSIFTESDTLLIRGRNPLNVEYLVVGGGGPGGFQAGGAGGAGGLISGSATLPIGNYEVTVGEGGIASTGNIPGTSDEPGQNGGFSRILRNSGGFSFDFKAEGGGYGGNGTTTGNPASAYMQGADGGSGGGGGPGAASSATETGGEGIPGQGNDGGLQFHSNTVNQRSGGGGGGASQPGTDGDSTTAGNGGNGSTWPIPASIATEFEIGEVVGSDVYFAGGGAGGQQSGPASTAGLGGGGLSLMNGKPHSGGGAGGGMDTNKQGGNGGSGIVIVRHQI